MFAMLMLPPKLVKEDVHGSTVSSLERRQTDPDSHSSHAQYDIVTEKLIANDNTAKAVDSTSAMLVEQQIEGKSKFNSQQHQNDYHQQIIQNKICTSNETLSLKKSGLLHWRMFVLIGLNFSWGWGSSMVYLVLPHYAKSISLSQSHAAFLFIFIGAGGFAGRIATVILCK